MIAVLILGHCSLPQQAKCDDDPRPNHSDILKSDLPLKLDESAISALPETQLRESLSSRRAQAAIIARWELLRRRLRDAKDQPKEKVEAMRSQEFGRFVGFLEAKAGVELPAWWTKALQHSDDVVDSDVFPSFAAGLPAGVVRDDRWWHSPNIRFRKLLYTADKEIDGFELTLTDGKSLRVDQISPYFAETNVACTVSGDNAVVALTPNLEMTYPLICHDGATAKERWRQNVWGSAIQGFSGPAPPVGSHVSEILVSRDSVVVCGADLGSAYCEGFSLSTGRPKFRFCPAIISRYDGPHDKQ